MELFVGTSGYSYKEWKGVFYPEKLPDKDMLTYYSGQLPSVEINNTFYRFPKTDMLENWANQVPDSFRFVLKASRKITHLKPLKEKQDEAGYLFETSRALEDRLGAILFQLPPYLRKNADLLSDFLKLVPKDIPSTFEFRHRSWFDDETYAQLRAANCPLCCSDTDNEDISKFINTADWGYLRLRKPGYTDKELEAWAARIQEAPWQKVFVYFKHEDEGAGPKMAGRFREIFESTL